MYIVPITQLQPIAGMEQAGQVAQKGVSMPFGDLLSDAIDNLAKTQAASSQDAYDLAMGSAGDMHNIMINSLAATTAMETTVQLTSRAVNAYKEIMQMQV